MKQFFRILAIGVVLIAGYVFYVHWSRTRALESGDVVEINQPSKTTEQTPSAPPPETARSETAPQSTQPAVPAPSQAAKPIAPAAPDTKKPAAIAPSEPAKTASVPSPSKAPLQELALNGSGPLQMHPQAAKPTAAILPDTVFTDKGRFQLYRQGDITWRMNTQTGKACVFLATEAQWSKTVVYENGCHGR